MPQPVYSDVHISAALTQISVAFLQSERNYVADKLFPIIPVVHQTDVYFYWNQDDFFSDQAQLRADATESAGGGANLTTQTYSASVWAIHKDIGDQVRRNADPAVDLDVTFTKWVMQQMLIRRERFFATQYITTGVWGTDITGVAAAPSSVQTIYWNDDANGDPISDVLLGQTTILQNTGYKPNKLLVTWPVYQALRKHPLIVDRIKYTMGGGALTVNITPELLAGVFDVEEVLVSQAVYNSAAEGATGSYSFIQGKNALLCYSTPNPGLMEPTAGYTFAWQGFTGLNNLGVRILAIPMPWLGSSMVRIDGEMAFDLQIVSKSLGYFFSGIVQ